MGLYAYEGFNYGAGTSLAGANGGLGWSGPWTNTSTLPRTYLGEATVSFVGMTYNGLNTLGRGVYLDPAIGTNTINESRFYRSLQTPPPQSPGSIVWGSFLAVQQNPAAGRFFNVSFSGAKVEKFNIGGVTSGNATNAFTSGTPTNAALTWGIGTWFYGNGYDQFRTSSIYQQVPGGPSNLAKAFMLFRVTYGNLGANNDRIDLWMNPNIANGEAGLGFPNLTVFGDCRFDTIRIGAGNTISASYPEGNGYIDEIRIADNFASAVGTTDIVMLSATTSDSKAINFTYEVIGNPVGEFKVSVYRSKTNSWPSDDKVLVTYQTVPSASPGVIYSATINDAELRIEPAHPYVLVIADADGIIPESNEDNNKSSFQKLVIGILTHGFQLFGDLPLVGGLPDWMALMEKALIAREYKVFKFDWSSYSNKPLPEQTTTASILLANEVVALIAQMNLSPTDVIDTHWIGHSRGAVVNGRALELLSNTWSMPSWMTRGWIKMTMLDPHPAKNGPLGPLCSFDPFSNVAWLLWTATTAFQAIAQDPDAKFPIRVNQAEVYFQHTSYRLAPGTGKWLNLWGVADIISNSHDWSSRGMGHSEIPEAYLIREIQNVSLASLLASASTTIGSQSTSQANSDTDGLFPEYVYNRGLALSLLAKLSTARAALERGNVAASRGALDAFINEVRAQRSNHIKAEAADLFIAAANSVLSSLK